MIGFEIWLNGERICTAGIDQIGSLNAIVTWAKRSDSTSDEELKLYLGGLACDPEGNDIYLKWLYRNLQINDEIKIKIVKTEQVDKPVIEKRELASFVEEQQRKYYEKLKQKYEN